jgi:hypothetical protein
MRKRAAIASTASISSWLRADVDSSFEFDFVLGAFDGDTLVGVAGCRRERLVKHRHTAHTVAQLVWTLFPGLGQGYDPAVMLLASFGLPMTVTAIAMMIWARRWRARRAAEVSRPGPVRRR